jgi:hypothetical protein
MTAERAWDIKKKEGEHAEACGCLEEKEFELRR